MLGFNLEGNVPSITERLCATQGLRMMQTHPVQLPEWVRSFEAP